MAFFYIFFILSCGFIVANHHLPARFRQNRTTGWDYYFRIAMLGIFCLIAGFTLTFLLDLLDLPSLLLGLTGSTVQIAATSWQSFGLEQITSRQLSVGLLSLLCAWAFAMFSRQRAKNPVKRIAQLASECSGHNLEKLLLDAIIFDMPVSVTLNSRKWYAGQVIDFAPEKTASKTFALLPMLSGYRRESDLQLFDTQNYDKFYEAEGIRDGSNRRLDLAHFRIVIPVNNISHIAMFDPETYRTFNTAITDTSAPT